MLQGGAALAVAAVAGGAGIKPAQAEPDRLLGILQRFNAEQAKLDAYHADLDARYQSPSEKEFATWRKRSSALMESTAGLPTTAASSLLVLDLADQGNDHRRKHLVRAHRRDGQGRSRLHRLDGGAVMKIIKPLVYDTTNVVALPKPNHQYQLITTAIDLVSPLQAGDLVAFRFADRKKGGWSEHIMLDTWYPPDGRDGQGRFVNRGSEQEHAYLGGMKYSPKLMIGALRS